APQISFEQLIILESSRLKQSPRHVIRIPGRLVVMACVQVEYVNSQVFRFRRSAQVRVSTRSGTHAHFNDLFRSDSFGNSIKTLVLAQEWPRLVQVVLLIILGEDAVKRMWFPLAGRSICQESLFKLLATLW